MQLIMLLDKLVNHIHFLHLRHLLAHITVQS
ncbi:hypothetical protein SAMN05444955_11784 [Lihuaxuella thermophila]|uniref:Uncharacterized protein n=1 Tax=Lihuaxuella thermophila TaxID=1173111 RepID=A0A1H8IHQ2_9BACL|nr:hypothetical protein SAMN05444955_11784 [Lihuaxuella thermophila]